jgi:hypothetical protein
MAILERFKNTSGHVLGLVSVLEAYDVMFAS